MSYIERVPLEILLEIFRYLRPRDIIVCRNVCQFWLTVVRHYYKDSSYWEKACKEIEYFDESVYQLASLTWCQLYQALWLWTKLDEANVTVHSLDIPAVDLPCPGIHIKEAVLTWHQADSAKRHSLVYCCLETLTIVHQRRFPFPFDSFQENQHFLVLRKNRNLHVFSKKIGKKAIIRNMTIATMKYEQWWLVDKEIYSFDGRVYKHSLREDKNFLAQNLELVLSRNAMKTVFNSPYCNVMEVLKNDKNELILVIEDTPMGTCIANVENKEILILCYGFQNSPIIDQNRIYKQFGLDIIKMQYHVQSNILYYLTSGGKKISEEQANENSFDGRVCIWFDVKHDGTFENPLNVFMYIKYVQNEPAVNVSKEVDINLTIRFRDELAASSISVVETTTGPVIVICHLGKLRFVKVHYKARIESY